MSEGLKSLATILLLLRDTFSTNRNNQKNVSANFTATNNNKIRKYLPQSLM